MKLLHTALPRAPRVCVKLDLGAAPAAPAKTLGATWLCTVVCKAVPCIYMPFCCSNNRISAVGALSLGLQVNQTLRIPVVSASLMREAPAQTCL